MFRTVLAYTLRNGVRRAKAALEGRPFEEPDSFENRFGPALGDALTAAARDNGT